MAFSVPPQPVIQAASVELKPYIFTWFFRRIRCNPKVRKFSSEAENMGQAKAYQEMSEFNSCAVIVAHPDDETLWAGGIILMYPEAKWTVVTLCRKNDPDRSPKFFRALEGLGASGDMGDLDDSPQQCPHISSEVQNIILELLPSERFDLIITHGLCGEYTRHLRHEETGKAVMALWESKKLFAKEVWRFAYEDGDGKYLPRPVQDADLSIKLPDEIWQKKYDIIIDIYGFGADSFEAKTTPREEAFWCFGSNKKDQKQFNK